MKTLDASPLGGAGTVPGRLFRAAIPGDGGLTRLLRPGCGRRRRDNF